MPKYISIADAQRVFSRQGLDIISHQGSGTFGDVFKAKDKDGNTLALKVLSPDGTDLRRFRREALALEKVDSPYVAKLYLWGLGDSEIQYPYLITNFIEGESLKDMQNRGERWSPTECITYLDYLLQGLGALASAGERGIVHRDIKPANIIIRSDGVPVIVDLGLVRHLDLSSLTPTEYGILGTPQYAPPELWIDPKSADGTTDMFSLGIVTYEMLSGEHPYLDGSETSFYDAKDKMLRGTAVDIESVTSSVPPKLARFIMLLIRREKSRRLRSVDYALRRLRAL